MPRVIDEFLYDIRQTDELRNLPDIGEDELFLRFVFEKLTGRVVPGEGWIVETRTLISNFDKSLEFSKIKRVSSDAKLESVFIEKITRYLSRVGVPESCFTDIINGVFSEVDMAVSTRLPLGVGIYDSTWIDECDPQPCVVPAAKSSIDGLKGVRLVELQDHVIRQTPSCAICLEDFAQQQQQDGGSVEVLVTRLPCSHLYHLDCIVVCLQRSNLCPVCRHAMPTQDQAS